MTSHKLHEILINDDDDCWKKSHKIDFCRLTWLAVTLTNVLRPSSFPPIALSGKWNEHNNESNQFSEIQLPHFRLRQLSSHSVSVFLLRQSARREPTIQRYRYVNYTMTMFSTAQSSSLTLNRSRPVRSRVLFSFSSFCNIFSLSLIFLTFEDAAMSEVS